MWNPVISSSRHVGSISLYLGSQISLFSVYNLDSPSRVNLNNFYMFSDLFLMNYGLSILPANYDEEVAVGKHAYIRYYDRTIHVMFSTAQTAGLPACYVYMILNYPCKLD